MAKHGHLAPVRVAVNEEVGLDRWKQIAAAMASMAQMGMPESVSAARFLAEHAPAPDELESEDRPSGVTLLAGPKQVDAWVAGLAAAMGCAPAQLPDVVAVLMEAREARKRMETASND